MTNSPPPASPEDEFWQFSLAVYQRPPVAQACLALQDNHGADVNLLLYCCWVAQRYAHRLSDAELDTLIGSVADWQRAVVIPLRGVRRRLKANPHAAWVAGAEVQRLRRAVKQAELDAERLEQQLLLAALTPPANTGAVNRGDRPAAIAYDSGLRYLQRLGADANDGAARRDLDALIAACFG